MLDAVSISEAMATLMPTNWNEIFSSRGSALRCCKKMQRPVTISTSARSNLILRDIDLLKQIPNLTVITELCRLDQLERLTQGQTHIGVDVSNDLHRAGVRVIGTFAPNIAGYHRQRCRKSRA